jgi:phosphoglycolate phosphatase-like HAD superfamily hydrolase
MPKTYYHAVMFDFDGTLVDTMHAYARIAAEEMQRRYGIHRETARQLYLETSGIPFFQQLDLIFGPDQRNAECAGEFEKRKAAFLQTIKMDAHTKDVISQIRSFGVSIAITSNNFQNIVEKFIQDEANLFDLVLGFSENMSKGPSQFTKVIDSFGVDRRYILFVGDSLSDVRKALAFGIDFVAISGTLKAESFNALFPATPVIASIRELQPLLARKIPLNNKEFHP